MITNRDHYIAKQEMKELALRDVSSFLVYNNDNYQKPKHLKEITDKLNEIVDGKVHKIAFSVPPQHHKSVTLLNFVAYQLTLNPKLVIAYASYAHKFATSQTRKAVQVFKRYNPTAKILIDTAGEFILESGGGLITTSVTGALTGYAIDILIIDDPIKDRAEAESPTYRNRVFDWWLDVAKTRVRPNHTSVVILHTRWHKDDLIGRLKGTETDFNFYNIPAINEFNEPLMHALEYYEDIKRANAYGFYSLYQGEPIRREGKIFGDFVMTETLPTNYKIGIGLDLAYSVSRNSDYSCYVVTLLNTDTMTYTVLETDHWQTDINVTIQKLKILQNKYLSTYMVIEKNGTQKAIYDLLRNGQGLRVFGYDQKMVDKLTRSISTSSLWNLGKVAVYNKDNGIKDLFFEQISNFTGINDPHDDYVDAFVYSMHLIKNVGAKVGIM